MLLRFTKMHSLGNDFMVIDMLTQQAYLAPPLIREWSDRRTGIGFDQLLVVEPPSNPDADFYYRTFNNEGDQVGYGGNGARCIARFVHDKRLTAKSEIHAETPNGNLVLKVRRDGQISVNLGVPNFSPAKVPFHTDADHGSLSYPLTVQDHKLDISVMSLISPHCVVLVDDLARCPVLQLGQAIERHPRFPQGVTTSFMQLINPHQAQLRVHIRGIGETPACGTAACAAAITGIRRGSLQSPVIMQQPGGQLTIEWAGPDQPVILTGPVTRVYEGQIRV